MRKVYLILLAAGIALSAVAQSKLDLHSRLALRQLRTESPAMRVNPLTKSLEVRTAPVKRVNCILRLNEGTTVEELEAAGANVQLVRGNIAFVTMPLAIVEDFSTHKGIKTMSLERPVSLKMDVARRSTGVDKIHQGTDLKQAYTGKGVIAGIVDVGIEPNHINFKNEDGSSRVKRFLDFYYPQGATSVTDLAWDEYYADDIKDFDTDYVYTYHGTHTLGIMAGGYKGTMKYSTLVDQAPAIVEGDCPYYGVATDAELVVSGGEMNSDYAIAMGVEQILDYSAGSGLPAVINMSLGSNYGARDGKQVMCDYLAEAGKEAIICMASGNEGEMPIAINKTFTAEDATLKTCLFPYSGTVSSNGTTFKNMRFGSVEFYSNDESEFEVDLLVLNRMRGSVIMRKTIAKNSDGNPTCIVSSAAWKEYDTDIVDLQFGRWFEGYVEYGSYISTDNGRYCVMYNMQVTESATNTDSNYVLAFEIRGKAGQRVDGFTDAQGYLCFSNYNMEGYQDGSCNGSISDMACGDNVIVVGSYNTKNYVVTMDKQVMGYTSEAYLPGKVSPFTSYATLIDGRKLPHILAPGLTVVSSFSAPYLEYYGATENNEVLEGTYVEADGKVNYWTESPGTSMATPVVAGIVALWLEADPTLDVKEALEIIEQTAVKDNFYTTWTGDMVQWGAGKIDAYAGLKEVIRRAGSNSGVQNVLAKTDRLVVASFGNKQYNVFLGGAEQMDVVVYNLQGQPVLVNTAEGDEVTIDASCLTAGVYVLNVNGNYSERILVK